MERSSRVVDPFCGSGTVLVEAQRLGFEGLGVDANPMAALVASVKLEYHDPNRLLLSAAAVMRDAKAKRAAATLPAEFLSRWFSPKAISVLSRLRLATEERVGDDAYDFLRVIFALAVRRYSFSDPRIPVPVLDAQRQAHEQDFSELWAAYEQIARVASRRVAGAPRESRSVRAFLGDARDSQSFAGMSGEVPAMIVTSPPYGAAQKYVRSTSLELGWLGLTDSAGTIALERNSIGREHLGSYERDLDRAAALSRPLREYLAAIAVRDVARARIYVSYFVDMRRAFDAFLANERGVNTVVMVAGTNTVAGSELQTHFHLAEMVRAHGFSEMLVLRDEIRGRGLLTKRRSSPAPTAAEFIHIMTRD